MTKRTEHISISTAATVEEAARSVGPIATAHWLERIAEHLQEAANAHVN